MTQRQVAISLPLCPVCPKCLQTLNLHSSRIDIASEKAERVDVYFCITHGFYRISHSQPLTPGM